MILLYSFGIRCYVFMIRVASPFNAKAKKWISGRRNIFSRIKREIKQDETIVWFHCASLGEFEQGRPLIEAYRKKYPEHKILLTFFSPSGYEVRKNYEHSDYIFYLPPDTKKNAQRFIGIVNPLKVIFIKYEFWFHYLREIKKRDIPVYSVSAIFRSDHYFFTWYGRWFLRELRTFSHIFVQHKHSLELLENHGFKNCSIGGDTRFDRVAAAVKQNREFDAVKRFCGSEKIILAGSTWPADEDILHRYIHENHPRYKFIIAPHEVHEDRIQGLIRSLNLPSARFTSLDISKDAEKRILVIDTIGILLHLYKYANIAYIGGAFGKGLHNILEAVAFGKPVIFGPNYKKFNEAVELTELKAVFPVSCSGKFRKAADKLLTDESFYHASKYKCLRYIEGNTGATARILNHI